jgi:hypothetical protein
MMRGARAILLLAVAVGLSACVGGWTSVPVKPAKLSGGLVLQPENEWSAIKYGRAQVWTVHGPPLEAVTVVAGLEDGKSIDPPVSYKDEMPLFRASMAASEVAEMVVETLLRAGYGRVELLGVRPESFASRPGFRFDLDLATGNGLEQSGFGAGAIVDGKLYLIAYRAPKLHYFEHYKPAVEKLIDTARIEGAPPRG